jgi:hypothetical protein
MSGFWNLWVKLNRVGRLGLFIVFLGLAMVGVGGPTADDRLSIVGAGIVVAGVVTMILNRRADDPD